MAPDGGGAQLRSAYVGYDVAVTVVIADVACLSTLASQVCGGVEVLICDGATWIDEAQNSLCADWAIRLVASPQEALREALGEFIIAWDVYRADATALAGLVEAARAKPLARGAIAANFDPAVVWRTRELRSPSAQAEGLAQANSFAINGGSPPIRLGY